jgi:hypothetical protein
MDSLWGHVSPGGAPVRWNSPCEGLGKWSDTRTRDPGFRVARILYCDPRPLRRPLEADPVATPPRMWCGRASDRGASCRPESHVSGAAGLGRSRSSAVVNRSASASYGMSNSSGAAERIALWPRDPDGREPAFALELEGTGSPAIRSLTTPEKRVGWMSLAAVVPTGTRPACFGPEGHESDRRRPSSRATTLPFRHGRPRDEAPSAPFPG